MPFMYIYLSTLLYSYVSKLWTHYHEIRIPFSVTIIRLNSLSIVYFYLRIYRTTSILVSALLC